ncbi:MAG: outer membrane protein assembly factor BamD [Methylococcales bacterium]|nr:outer membrane protein assembly factor BamD [Methylococcales bacterium]
MRLILIKILFIGCLSLALSGCGALSGLGNMFSGDSDSTEDDYVGWDVQQFRSEAKTAVDAGSYEKAVKLYETIETRYPFGDGSAQTELDLAYAYYKAGKHEEAVATADRFIKMNPRSVGVDYALYLKGLANYNRDIGFVDRFLPTDTAQRDQNKAQIAYNNFKELITRFPNSRYVADAKLRMIALNNNLAMHEVHIARYYMSRKAYVAAASRASDVVEHYQGTPAVPYALQVMKEAYVNLGMTDLAKDAARVYELNYPNGPPVPEHSEATVSHKVWDFIGLEK